MSETQVETKDVKQSTTQEQGEKQAPVNDVPYARFKEVNDEKNKMKSEFEALKKQLSDDVEARELKAMEEKGDYEQALSKITLERDELREYKSVKEAEYEEERNVLLEKLSDDDKAVYSGLNNSQLQTHINKTITKPNVPNVDTTQAGAYQGYDNLVDAAKDVSQGKLDKKSYVKIKEAFTSRINRA